MMHQQHYKQFSCGARAAKLLEKVTVGTGSSAPNVHINSSTSSSAQVALSMMWDTSTLVLSRGMSPNPFTWELLGCHRWQCPMVVLLHCHRQQS